MENAYIINGGKPLQGSIQLSGAKNIALKIIIAALLFDSSVTLKNIPRIQDVEELLQLIRDLGGKAEFIEKNTLLLDGSGMHKSKVNMLYGAKIRVSFLFFAPLLHKFGQAEIPNPGGCRLGARSIDRIIEAIQALGVKCDYESETGYYTATLPNSVQGNYSFAKPTHTGTELLIMMGVLAKSTIVVENAALEPEIDDLIEFLHQGGAKIRREDKKIIIEGVLQLVQQTPYTIAADRVEAVTYAIAALATKGDIRLHSIKKTYLDAFIEKIQEAGGGVEQQGDDWRFYYKGPLQSVNIETQPYPGFLTDWQPMFAVLMTQAEGESIIHERIFENRFSYVDELNKLGAHIQYTSLHVDQPHTFYQFNYDPAKEYQQAIVISGAKTLHSGAPEVKDLRAGATLAIAALCAEGESVVNGIHHLERGYEDFIVKIQSLGGNIKRV